MIVHKCVHFLFKRVYLHVQDRKKIYILLEIEGFVVTSPIFLTEKNFGFPDIYYLDAGTLLDPPNL